MKSMETLAEKIRRVTAEDVAVVPYDPRWPMLFEMEKNHLRACLPEELIGRIEHFGSTAVPGLAAKPVVDILVEVPDLEETKRRVAPILEGQGYDYFWRPSWDDGRPPFYAWFIKRDGRAARTHHLHMVEPHFEHWDRLLFRDYLIFWSRRPGRPNDSTASIRFRKPEFIPKGSRSGGGPRRASHKFLGSVDSGVPVRRIYQPLDAPPPPDRPPPKDDRDDPPEDDPRPDDPEEVVPIRAVLRSLTL
jgi:GrpB-like predicted nucleotidyltransferase (UPF0157 family)